MPLHSLRQAAVHMLAIAVLSASAIAQTPGAYKVTNLVSDGSVPAVTTDPNFINPWGISVSPTWWISAQGTGYNYVTSGAGAISFKVIVPAASGLTSATGLPSGSVTTAGSVGMILPNQTKASFLFSTLDGTISGWNSKLGTANAISQVVVNNSSAGAVYTGLAILNTATASYLLAPNFGTGNAVEVYDSNFKAAKLTGSFTDPSLPANYAPYSVHVIGTQIFVAYALRTATAPYRTVNAAGNGIVDVYDVNGSLVSRVVTGGNLNAPWGVAFAPANFGIYSKDLLIGNFGDGLIDVYDPKTFAYLGQLMDGTGTPLVYASLWDLLPGNTPTSAGDASTVYFTAGLTGEAHGLLAGISNDSTTKGTPSFGMSSSSPAATVTAGNPTQVAISIAPTYNFSGTVTLGCSGLPNGAVCLFSPSTFTVSGNAPTTGTVFIQTTHAAASAVRPNHFGAVAILSALLLPFASMPGLRRRVFKGRRSLLSLLPLALLTFAATTLIAGCSMSNPSSVTAVTPAGTSNVVITATAGSISQKTTLALTVQ